MEIETNAHLPEPAEKPATPIQEQVSPENNKLLLKAQCDEKEEHYEKARDQYINLGRTEDALRCSAKLQLKTWRKRNLPYIIALAGSSGIIMIAFFAFLILLNNKQRSLVSPSVQWINQGKVELSSYPSWFLYDKKSNSIRTRAVIDEKMKAEIEKIYPWKSDSTNYVGFRQAIEQLAFKSAEMKGSYYWLLLLLSGLAAVVGVLIREILDMIRHYSYEKDLDFTIWWPWYLLRPFVGFVIGIMIILFSGTDLLISSGNNNSEIYMIAISIIAGISVEDVMFKIRKVSQVLFGNSNQEAGQTDTSQNLNQQKSGNQTGNKQNVPVPTDQTGG